MSKPKKGDVVSQALSGAGYTTWEKPVITKVSKGKVWTDYYAEGTPFDIETGEQIDGGFAGFSKRIIFDGGRAADKETADGDNDG